MRCPKCTQEDYHHYATCAQCGFTGPPAQVEELAHIAYLLSQLDAWDEIGAQARAQLHARYQDRRTRLEIDLGLRPLPLSAEEARKLHWDLVCARALLEELTSWQVQGWMRREPAARLRQGVEKRIDSLRQKVKDTPPAPAFEAVDDRLKLLDYLAGMADTVRRNLYFVDDAAHTSALARLQARRREIEIEAGLRPPEPVLVPVAVPVPMAVPEPVPAPAPARPARPPREPITWDRIGQTLLSQRTLNVLLFLGAFLLMASAATYLVYNWEALPPAAQLAFILLFTLAFYGAGWFLRVRMGLRKSGIAVTAIGSLLVPLDFYAIFLAGGVFPAEEWPWVWLLASAVCLPIYTLTALRLRAEFFGYTVAVAAGSLLLAALQVAGSPPDWWLAAVTALALASVVLAHRLQSSPKAWSILSSPLRFSALVASAATLLVGLGWWAVGGARGLPFDASLALAWALGAALYGYTAFSERSAWLGRAAAGVLPVALALLLRLAFVPLEVSTPWYALGWAALAPAYLWAGYRWLGHARQPAPQPADAEPAPEGEAAAAQGHASPEPESSAGQAAADPVLRAHGQTAAGWGLALMAVAAVWAAFDLQSPTLLAGWAAAATHALLVAGVGLAVRLWQKPRALPAASLLALSATTFGMAAGHLEPAELCVGWALLAVLHVLGALMLRKAPDYAARLFGAALGVNALALLPPLVLAHENWLAYVVGHWIALAAWLVWLDHAGQQPGLEALLSRAGPLRRSALHWLVALPLPLFSALLYTRFRSMDAWLGLVVAGLAWGCCAVGHLRRPSDWQLRVADWRFPWYVVGYGCSLAGPALAFYAYDQPLLAVTVLLGSALYFASSWALRIKWWLVPAGLSLPLGLLLLLHLWAVPPAQQSLVLAGVMAAYLLGGLALERHRGVPAGFMAPLYGVAHGVAVTGLAWGLVPAAEHLAAERPWSDAVRLWTAGGQLLLAGVYALWAWFRAQEGWAHLAAWLGVLAGGVAASAYSMGHGSAAFKAALGAAVYVLLERALNSQALQRRWAGAAQAWPLYRRALLVAGWAISGGAIGLALIRNLVLLGGGRIQTVWAIAGLLVVTALYAASAWLFRRPFFAWLAERW